MVFGKDMVANTLALSQLTDMVEIVLFHTPALHNIPSPEEITALKKISEESGIGFTIHLPASLEIASADSAKRKEHVRRTCAICRRTLPLNPVHYILHVPFSPPTLAPVPGLYFKSGKTRQTWRDWTERALTSLETIHAVIKCLPTALLVENINYSPYFLEPFWNEGPCGFCLDIGHLLLGRENVVQIVSAYSHVTQEIHIHGVRGFEDHISLAVLPPHTVRQWFEVLMDIPFAGVMNFEVFSPEDLFESLRIVFETSALKFRPKDIRDQPPP